MDVDDGRIARTPFVTTEVTFVVLQQAFDKFDSDGSGLLDENEFAQAMHVLGLRLSKEEYQLLFKEYDADGSGEIDLVSARPAQTVSMDAYSIRWLPFSVPWLIAILFAWIG